MWSVYCIVVVYVMTATASLLPLEAERLHATIGGYAVMNCHLDFPFGNEIPYHLQWDKDGEPIFSWYSGDVGDGSGMGHTSDRWSGRVRRLSDGRLDLGQGSINISSVRETDAGLYRCRVSFPNRSPPQRNNGTFYYLDVDGANVIVTPPMNVTVMEGSMAELECIPKSPEWPVLWYKDEVPLSQYPDSSTRLLKAENGSLIISKTVSEDAGEYECHVQAPDGTSQSAAAYLDVQYKAKVVYSSKEKYLPHGKSASLDCHFSANPPLTNLRWEKDGFLFDPYNVPGVFYSRNGSLLFNKVDETHEGFYSCTPYNVLGTEGPSPPVRVHVQMPPALAARPQPLYLTRLGTTLTVPCVPTVHPHQEPNVIHWTRKDGGLLPAGRHLVNGGNLTISNVAEEDRGIYVCTASNEADAVSVETELLIENVPPRAPFNLTAVPSYDSIHLSWLPGHNGVQVDYHVWYRERTVSEWRTMKILSLGVTEATLVGLRPGVEYELRVLSQDQIGDGLFSKPLFVRTLDLEGEENSASAYAAVITESVMATETDLNEDLEVAVRLIDEGALVSWKRDELDESRCTVRWFNGDPPDHKLLFTAHTNFDYVIVPSVEEGKRYWTRVECANGWGGASVHVPEYSRLRAIAIGSAVAALILVAVGMALYTGRYRLGLVNRPRRPPPPPPRNEKRLR